VAERTIARLRKRHGWRKVTPRPRHPRSDPDEPAAWNAAVAKQVVAAVGTRAADAPRPVVVMAQDAGRFGRISRPQRCWAPNGVRPSMPQQIVRDYTYVSTAVAPGLGRMTARIVPRANTAMMHLFLAHVAETFPDYGIVMQVDQSHQLARRQHQRAAIGVVRRFRPLVLVVYPIFRAGLPHAVGRPTDEQPAGKKVRSRPAATVFGKRSYRTEGA